MRALTLGDIIHGAADKRGTPNPPDATDPETLTSAPAPRGDKINHPPHYTQGSVECIDALAAVCADLQGMEAVCTANAIKYLWRWKHKGGADDLKKARWYIDRLIEVVE